jgi:hypothetical protein
MSRHPLRRLFAVLLTVAFFSASMMQFMPAMAAPAQNVMAMSMQGDGHSDTQPMPCKGMTPACMIDLGCIFMIGVPTPGPSPIAARLTWTQVSYRLPSGETPDGSDRAPDLRPPIRLI